MLLINIINNILKNTKKNKGDYNKTNRTMKNRDIYRDRY